MFQPIFGVPFERQYLPAVVLHDHYSKSRRPVRGWLETQRMFREALIANGVGLVRANVMFAAVLIGSGKWAVAPVRGVPCQYGATCIQSVDAVEIVISREADINGTDAHRAALARATAVIEADDGMSEAGVEALALSLRPDRPATLQTLRLTEVSADR